MNWGIQQTDDRSRIGKRHYSGQFPDFGNAEEISVKLGLIYPRSESTSVVVHLVEKDISLRANIARRLIALGFHAEIYSGTQELIKFAPKDGVIFINDADNPDDLTATIDDLEMAGFVLPIVVYCRNPTIEGVVAAMKARAVNYLSLELADTALATAVNDAHREGEKKRSFLSHAARCGKLIAHLTQREKQVLEMLVDGESNKGIGRSLGLSPRTVEIHRMKLMGKLGANSLAQAVKMWCAANLVS